LHHSDVVCVPVGAAFTLHETQSHPMFTVLGFEKMITKAKIEVAGIPALQYFRHPCLRTVTLPLSFDPFCT